MFIFNFKCQKMFRFSIKMPYKKLFILLNIKNLSKSDPDPDPVFLRLPGSGRIRSFWGCPDPDPDFENRIRRSGSEKMNRVRNTASNTIQIDLDQM